MGVPKFYRWISERYPTLSEVISDSQIPEFDNLYLDMNGIIHNCSHPNDDDVTFRISEEQINQDIFDYIEKLFSIIRPQKVFFMAVDGVAPRAKMNQQRARRFMSARTAQEQMEKAIKKGEEIPKEARFDSNCITPGTPFMARLHAALQKWIQSKIDKDQKWQNIRIILSGHDVPGEGEHKIMDFIRYERSQPGYEPNTRHCMYGLDADLMMLGICSHEPHFSLLREEVKFTNFRKSNQKKKGDKQEPKRCPPPSETTFHLLHLSLMREYLYWEFVSLKDKLSFPYDMERIADDWILMCFLVGNDFIPHLPHVHIHDDGLPFLYDAYRKVLPTLDGYINESGNLNLKRFEKFLKAVAENDKEHFLRQLEDKSFLESKREQGPNHGKPGAFDALMEEDLVEFADSDMESESSGSELEHELAEKQEELSAAFVSSDEEEAEEGEDSESSSSGTNGLIASASEALAGLDLDDPAMTEFEQELAMAQFAPMDEKAFESNVTACWSRTVGNSFKRHKREYYKEKLRFGNISKDQLKAQSEGYVRAIQWVLHYYYHGCCSWSWYFQHHYAPYISDVTDFGEMEMAFEQSEPFHPFEQLLAVLPAASAECLPPTLRELMCANTSPIADFYPTNFKTDLNGKKNDWEAVVLIPFIDEKRLLEAIRSREQFLSDEEKKRNAYGSHLEYTTIRPGNAMPRSHVEKVDMNKYRIPRDKVIWGLLPNVKLDVYFPGFPTMKHLPHTGELKTLNVQVFNMASRKPSMMLTIGKREEQERDLSTLAADLIGKEVCVEWPVLKMGIVDHVQSLTHSYKKSGASEGEQLTVEDLNDFEKEAVRKKISELKDRLIGRFAIECGQPKAVVYVRRFLGVTYKTEANFLRPVKQYGPSETAIAVPINLVVSNIAVNEGRRLEEMPIEKAYAKNSKVFVMVPNNKECFGYPCLVDAVENPGPNCRIRVMCAQTAPPNLTKLRQNLAQFSLPWFDQFTCAKKIQMNRQLFGRITGTVFLVDGDRAPEGCMTGKKMNIGLNLKLTKRNLEVPDYTRRINGNMWLYSDLTIRLVEDYRTRFPDIFKILEKSTTHNDEYFSHEIWEDAKKREERVAALKSYLDALPINMMEKQECGSLVVDSLLFSHIELAHEERPKQTKMWKGSVHPGVIYKPELYDGKVRPDPEADFQLLDRVVNTSGSGIVPFGNSGTIIGIFSDKLEVLFDIPFTGGFKRGTKEAVARVPIASVINITFGQERKNRSKEEKKPQQKTAHGKRKQQAPISTAEKPSTSSETVLKLLKVKQEVKAGPSGLKSNSSVQILKRNEGEKEEDFEAKKKNIEEHVSSLLGLLGINGKKAEQQMSSQAVESLEIAQEAKIMKILKKGEKKLETQQASSQAVESLEIAQEAKIMKILKKGEKKLETQQETASVKIVESSQEKAEEQKSKEKNSQAEKPGLLPIPPANFAMFPSVIGPIPPLVQPIQKQQHHQNRNHAETGPTRQAMIPTSNVDPMKVTDLKPSTISTFKRGGTSRGGARGGRGGQRRPAAQQPKHENEEPKDLEEVVEPETKLTKGAGKKQRKSRLAANLTSQA